MKLLSFLVCAVTAVSVFAADPEKIAELKAGKIDTAYASWWGFDEEDSTRFLQDAVSSGAKKVIVDYTGKDWIIGKTIQLGSDLELIFADKVVVRAKKGEFKRISPLFRCREQSNLIIRGEGSAALMMNKEEYTTQKGHRHVISLFSATNVTIRDLSLVGSGGDGIYVGGGGKRGYSKDIRIENIVADKGERLGMAVISAENVLIRNCRFTNTQKSSPAGGIDLEPNRVAERLVNIRIEDCEFLNNHGAGISVSPNHLGENSPPVSIIFKNCRSNNNGLGLFLYSTRNHQHGLIKGRVEFIGCDFSANRNLFSDTVTDSIRYVFRNCRFSNSPKNLNYPVITIVCKAAAGRKIGGLQFENCTVTTRGEKNAPIVINYLGMGDVSDDIIGTLQVDTGTRKYMFDFSSFLKERQEYFSFVNRLEEAVLPDAAKLKPPVNPVPRSANHELYTRGNFTYLQYAGEGQKIGVKARSISGGYAMPTKIKLLDPAGNELKDYTVFPDNKPVPIDFTAKTAGYYRITGGGVQRMDISSPHPGNGYLINEGFQVLLPIRGKAYFEVPPGVSEFHIGVSADGADAGLIDPSGKVVAKENNIRSMVIFTGRRADTEKSEIWAVQVYQSIWQVNLRMFAPLIPLYSTNPSTLPLLGDPAKVVMPSAILQESAELLRNGDFEKHRNGFPLYWRRSGNQEGTIKINHDQDNGVSLSMQNPNGTLNMTSTSNIPAKPGETFSVRLKVRGSGGFAIGASCYGTDKRWLRPNIQLSETTVDSKEWQIIEQKLTIANQEIDSYRLIISVSSSSKLDFDDITVNK